MRSIFFNYTTAQLNTEYCFWNDVKYHYKQSEEERIEDACPKFKKRFEINSSFREMFWVLDAFFAAKNYTKPVFKTRINNAKFIEFIVREIEKVQNYHSRKWITEKGLTIKDVESPDDKDKPFFGHIDVFLDWIKTNSDKKYASWNGVIFPLDDASGDAWLNYPGKAIHLKEKPLNVK